MNSTVAHFLKKLEEFEVISAPIVNEKKNIIGVVDVLDIVLFILGLFPKDVPIENLNEQELRKVLSTGSKFENLPISQVLTLSQNIKRDYQHVFTVKKSTPLDKLLEMFFQGVHRVLVVEEDSDDVINLVSQSDLLGLLAQCLPYLEEKEIKKTVQELNLSVDTKHLTSVLADTKTIEVLSMMQPNINKPIFSAVPIVDKAGHLIGNFSASNLMGLRQSSFVSLLLPVLSFLVVQPETNDFKKNLTRFKSVHPVSCHPTTSFDTIVERMVAHRVHRLWVVEDQKVVGVVSIGDVFKVFLPWANAQ